MKILSSRDNPLLKHLRRLLRSASARRQANETLLDGAHLIAAYVQAHGGEGMNIVVGKSKLDAAEVRALLDKVCEAQWTAVEDALIDSISPSDSPTGLVAAVPIPRLRPCTTASRLLLEGVQDPGNLGSILRTAAAAGFTEVLLSEGCADPWSPKCLRGGMGAQFEVNIHPNVDLAASLKSYAGPSLACDPHGGRSLYDLDLRGALAVVVGSEGAGLSSEVLAVAGHRCHIPMRAGSESLNVGAAAAIVMYEHVRQNMGFA